jgi:steroid 5-alpha reductase family enzyme
VDVLAPDLAAIVPGALRVWAALLGGFTLLWVASLPLRNASIVDMWWGPAFVLAWVVYAGAHPRWTPRAIALGLLVGAWALRLAWHIGRRNVGHGEDPRYATWRREHGASWWWFSWVKVFFLQATIAWIVSWPIGAAMRANPSFPTFLDLAGLALALAGLAFEATADAQLRRFRASAPPGAVCDVGLWRYSRHPNYFGEAVVWWGIGLVALGVPGAWPSLVSPLLMTWLLVRVSGVAMLEPALVARKPAYADYVRRTPAFVPGRPRPRDP